MMSTLTSDLGFSRFFWRRRLEVAMLAGLWCGGASCGDDPVKEKCSAAEVSFSCGASLDEGQFDQAVKQCESVHADAKDVSEDCAAAHLAFLDCIGTEADCNTIDSWRQDKCGESPDTVCAAKAADFCDACPGLWFAPP